MKKIIIMADGNAKRWIAPFRKQFLEIDGQRIIERTIDLLTPYGYDIYIATRYEDFHYLKEMKNVKIVVPKNNEHEITKFWSTHELWEDDDETLWIYGDVYFTEQTIKTIIEHEHLDYTFFMGEGEIFALKMKQNTYNRLRYSTEYIKNLADDGLGGLCGAWTLYRLMQQKDLLQHQKYSNYVKVDSKTFDFDGEADVKWWKERNPEHHVNYYTAD